MAQWNTNYTPKCEEKNCSDEVLVTVDNGRYKRVLKAVYIPYHHCTVEDMGWIPQGWYEKADCFEDYSYAMINVNVIAWSKLPKPYEPRVKQFK